MEIGITVRLFEFSHPAIFFCLYIHGNIIIKIHMKPKCRCQYIIVCSGKAMLRWTTTILFLLVKNKKKSAWCRIRRSTSTGFLDNLRALYPAILWYMLITIIVGVEIAEHDKITTDMILYKILGAAASTKLYCSNNGRFGGSFVHLGLSSLSLVSWLVDFRSSPSYHGSLLC